MDVNTAMEAVRESAKAATKFQEIIQKIFNPKWKRAQTDADMDANERKLQMIRDNPDMDIVFIGDEMHARKSTPEELSSRAEQRMLIDAVRQEANIEKVLEITAKELPSAETVADEPVDEDWITRFFNIVKDVNSEDVQYVWGKILAGEIQRPRSFSMRTLDTIRNVSKDEATLFQKVCNCALRYNNDVIIPSDLHLLETKGIHYNHLVLLSEAGLLNLEPLATAANFPANATMHMKMYNKTHLIHITGKTAGVTVINYGLYMFTKAGAELYGVLETTSDEDYIVRIAKRIGQVSKQKADVFVHKNISCVDGKIFFEGPPIFTQRRSSSN